MGGNQAENKWSYASKFGYGLGEGSYSMRIKTQGEPFKGSFKRLPPVLNLEVYLDEEWDKVESIPACRRAREAPARRTLTIDLNDREGEYGFEATGLVYHVMRPHIWYFVLSDCKGELGNESVPIDFELHAQQPDGSELSVEARHMPIAEGLALLCLTGLLVRGASRALELRKSAGALHPVVWALGAGVALQYASQVLHLIHLLKYSFDGMGIWTFDALAEVFFMISQVGHATLLIAIAQGYTLLLAKNCHMERSRLAFVATLAAHAALVCFGKLQEGTASDRHHKNDGPVGWAIFAIRLVLFSWFLRSSQMTKAQGGLRLREFLSRFQMAGSMYFLAYPSVFLIAQAFAPYLRHPIMQVGMLSVQGAADLWLANLFLSRGAYFKVSTLSASLLPGATAGGAPVVCLSKCD